MHLKDKPKVSLIYKQKISNILLIPGLEQVLKDIRHNFNLQNCNILFQLLEKYDVESDIDSVTESYNDSDDDSDDDYIYESEDDSDEDDSDEEFETDSEEDDSDEDDSDEDDSDEDDSDEDDSDEDDSEEDDSDEDDSDEDDSEKDEESEEDGESDSMESAFDEGEGEIVENVENVEEFDENIEKDNYLLWKPSIDNKLPVEICVLCENNHPYDCTYIFKTNPENYSDASDEVFNYLSNNKIMCNICGEYIY
jgi:hypothetical protein